MEKNLDLRSHTCHILYLDMLLEIQNFCLRLFQSFFFWSNTACFGFDHVALFFKIKKCIVSRLAGTYRFSVFFELSGLVVWKRNTFKVLFLKITA